MKAANSGFSIPLFFCSSSSLRASSAMRGDSFRSAIEITIKRLRSPLLLRRLGRRDPGPCRFGVISTYTVATAASLPVSKIREPNNSPKSAIRNSIDRIFEHDHPSLAPSRIPGANRSDEASIRNPKTVIAKAI